MDTYPCMPGHSQTDEMRPISTSYFSFPVAKVMRPMGSVL